MKGRVVRKVVKAANIKNFGFIARAVILGNLFCFVIQKNDAQITFSMLLKNHKIICNKKMKNLSMPGSPCVHCSILNSGIFNLNLKGPFSSLPCLD